jgi:hypothetical protein
MQTLKIYRKSDGKECYCDRNQLEAMTSGQAAKYSVKPVKIKKKELTDEDKAAAEAQAKADSAKANK